MTYKDPKEIIENTNLSKSEKVSELTKMRNDARAMQRADTEGPISEPAGETGPDLQDIDNALEELGVKLASIEDGEAATL